MPVTDEKLRMFLIGTSDYSDRVLSWPKFTRQANDFRSISVSVPLDNNSADLNSFYNNLYTIPQTCYLKISDPSTDYDLRTIFTGYLQAVKYQDNKCILQLKDKLFDFYNIAIGTNEAPIEINNVIPSDLLWSVCTSYGLLDSTADSSNPDIDYQSYQDVSYVFSYDNIMMSGRFAGTKISQILTDFVKMTNCTIYIERDGKLKFKNFLKEQSSSTIYLAPEYYKNFDILIDTKQIINKQYIYFDYAASDNLYSGIVYREIAASQNSYGLHENILKSSIVWLETSADANIIADQILSSYKNPSKEIEIQSTLYARSYEIGDAICLVNSFYGISSSTNWRITKYSFDMSNGEIIFTCDGTKLNKGFYLDISYLDGEDLLL